MRKLSFVDRDRVQGVTGGVSNDPSGVSGRPKPEWFK